MIPHRLNHGYYMSGKAMTLKDRYAVPEEELQRLRRLSLASNDYGKGMRWVAICMSNKIHKLVYWE